MTERTAHAFPWRITAVVAVVVIAATVAAGLLLGRDGMQPSPPVASAPSTPTSTATTEPSPLAIEEQRQVTVLLTVRDTDRRVVSAVLMGVGGDTGYVAELMLPPDLLLPTVPPIQLEQATDPTGGQTAEAPLETMLGVQVDALVDLDRLAWTGLVDATGLPVEPDRADNPVAFPLLLDDVLAGLPEGEELVGQLLTGLGSMARTTVTNQDLSHLLAVLADGVRTQPVRREPLAVTYLRAGESRVAVAQQGPAQEQVTRLFPSALLQPGHSGQRRVVLHRSGATIGAAAAARLALVSAGFGVVEDRSASEPTATSVVLVPDDSDASRSAGADVAGALGLPETSVRVDTSVAAVVDVRVTLGSDYRMS